MAETERPSPDRHRRRLGLLAAVAVVLAGIALIGSRLGAHSGPLTSIAPSPTSVSSLPSSGEPPPTQPAESAGVSSAPASASLGYLVLPADLADRASKAAQGVEPWQAAQQGLLSDVDAALNGSPHPKVNLNITGTEGAFVDDTASAYGLALAYAVTGNQQYAVQARSYIMAWASTTTRLVNACPDTGACQTSLIVGRVEAAETWISCTPAEIATYQNRVHVRCAAAVGGVSFFAAAAQDTAFAARVLLSALFAARMTGFAVRSVFWM